MVDQFEPSDFIHFPLLGSDGARGRISFVVDLSELSCGCNAAVYLTALPAVGRDGAFNRTAGGDFYCDAGAGGDAHCPEVDLPVAVPRNT